MLDELARIRASRSLSHWLRHKPERGGLTLDDAGWATLDAVVEALARNEIPATETDLRAVVATDEKNRFEIERNRIRARFGHSVPVEKPAKPGMPPATLYVGIAHRFLAKVLENGLRPVRRSHLHLSTNRSAARQAALRRGIEPAILKVLAHQAHAQGVKFYPRGQSVWLSEPIPAQFLQVVQTGTMVHDRPEGSHAPGARNRPRAKFIKRPRQERNPPA